VSINKAFKEFLRGQFHVWYASEVSKQSQQGSEEVKLVDFHLSQVKPLVATWIIQLINYLKMHPEITVDRPI